MKREIELPIIGKAYPTDGGYYRCFDGEQWHYCDKHGNIERKDGADNA